MYTHICISLSLSIYIYIYIHIHTYAYVYIYIYIYVYLSMFSRRRDRRVFYILQRGVQWKQGVVVYMMFLSVLLCNTTPIHCTPLRLHPPLMNTQVWRIRHGRAGTDASDRQLRATHRIICVSIYIYIYIHIHIGRYVTHTWYIYIYIYIYKQYAYQTYIILMHLIMVIYVYTHIRYYMIHDLL